VSAAFKIPVVPSQNQRLTIVLSGLQYDIVFRWNAFSSAWNMDVSDPSGNPQALGLPLITGADLLAQLAYLGIGGQMIVQSDGVTDAVPTFDSLGSTGHLYYRVSDAQAAKQVTSNS
jgi:hypothetical protein